MSTRKSLFIGAALSVAALSIGTGSATANAGYPDSIVSAANGQCLSAVDQGREKGSPVELDDCAGLPSQGWGRAELTSGEAYTIINHDKGSCLAVNNRHSNGAGLPVVLGRCDESESQQWTIEHLSADGAFRIVSKFNGLCLTANAEAPGSQISVEKCKRGSDNQTFLMSPLVRH